MNELDDVIIVRKTAKLVADEDINVGDGASSMLTHMAVNFR